MGCTEPVAVALAVAKATELLGRRPEKITVALSPNVLKNAMGVGIPGTGMIGLPIAIALGAIIGKSEYGLEVLKDVSADAVSEGRRYIDDGRVEVKLCENVPSILHIEAEVEAGADKADAHISGYHTNFVHLAGPCLESPATNPQTGCCDSHQTEATGAEEPKLHLSEVWEYATTSPLEEIDFIL